MPSPQDISQGIPFSSVVAEHLEYLGVTVKQLGRYSKEVLNQGEDVRNAAADFLIPLYEKQKVLIDDVSFLPLL